KRIPTNNFYSSTYSYFFCTTKKKYIHNSNVNQKTLSNIEKFFETDIKKINSQEHLNGQDRLQLQTL
ncbi:MAG: hypothetical protein QF394_14000, partial [Rhodospirillales bacterium]|nr:hypothetical protein [Rhodospirillales bacterium]